MSHSRSEWDYNEEMFTNINTPADNTEPQPTKPFSGMKQSWWTTVLEIIVLVLVLGFCVGVAMTWDGSDDRAGTVSVGE